MYFLTTYRNRCVALIAVLFAAIPASVFAMQQEFINNNLQALLADQKKAHTDLLTQLFLCKSPADLTKFFKAIGAFCQQHPMQSNTMLTTIEHNPKVSMAYNFTHALLEFYGNDWQYETPWYDAQGNIIAHGFLIKLALGEFSSDYQALYSFYDAKTKDNNIKTWDAAWLPVLGGMEHTEYILTALIMLGIEDMHNDRAFRPVLFQAIGNNRIDNVKALIRCGVDVNCGMGQDFGVQYGRAMRPLEYAIDCCQDDQIITILLKAKAQVFAQDVVFAAGRYQLPKLKEIITKAYQEQQK